MKKTLFFTLFLLTISAAPVLAQDPAGSASSSWRQRWEEVKENFRDRQEDRAQIKEEIKENIASRRAQFLHQHAYRLERRFNFYYQRFQKLIAKLRNRLEIMEGNGQPVQEAKDKLILLQAQLEEARDLGNQAITAFRSVDPESDYSSHREIAFAARDLAIESRRAYLALLDSFKEIVSLLKNIA